MVRKFNPRAHLGFSLVETLVAITLLLLVMVGPLAITSRTAASATFASEQVVAHFLAQEGLEIAQKARDDLILQSSLLDSSVLVNMWDVFTNPAGTYSNCWITTTNTYGCGLEMTNAGTINIVSCSTITNCRLSLDLKTTPPVSRSMYTYTTTGNTPTPYTRVIKFTSNSLYPDEMQVESTVTWRTGSLVANQRVSLKSALFNIYGL